MGQRAFPVKWIESHAVVQVSRLKEELDHAPCLPHIVWAAVQTCATVTCCMHW